MQGRCHFPGLRPDVGGGLPCRCLVRELQGMQVACQGYTWNRVGSAEGRLYPAIDLVFRAQALDFTHPDFTPSHDRVTLAV